MTATDVLNALRDEMVNAGLVRRASVAGPQSAPKQPDKPDADPPPCHVEPDAPPAPGEREAPEDDATLVVTLRASPGFGEQPFDSYRRRVIVDIIFRSKGTGALKRANALNEAIDNLIAGGRPDFGFGWTMGEPDHPVLVLSSQRYTDIGPVSRDAGQGSTEQAKFYFEVKAR